MMQWERLLSLKKQGDTTVRIRKEQDQTRLGFEVDYDRIYFRQLFVHFKTRHKSSQCQKQILFIPD